METEKQALAVGGVRPVRQKGKDILDDPGKTRLFITRLRARIANVTCQSEHERLSRLLQELESWLASGQYRQP